MSSNVIERYSAGDGPQTRRRSTRCTARPYSSRLAENPEKIRAQRRAAQRRWEEANPEKARDVRRAAQRRWAEANPEKNREKTLRWREKNLEWFRAQNREAARLKRIENPEKAREKNRETRRRLWSTNPEKAREQDRARHARRVARRGGTTACRPRGAPDGWAGQLLDFQGERCAYCRDPLPERGWHLEHVVPLSRGGEHVWENVVASCLRCNMIKGAKLPEEVFDDCAAA